MLYKMYYKSNIELIHLFVTKTMCHIFLQVVIFNKKIAIFFREFPFPIPSRPGPDRDGTSSGWGTGRKPRPVPFSGRDTGQGRPILSRPMNTPRDNLWKT